MDWDVRLKSQLQDAAKGVRTLFPPGSSPHSPYGDDWDIFWIGHCGDQFPENRDENRIKPEDHPGMQYMKRKYLIENDPTVPPREKIELFWGFKPEEHTRYVYVSGYPVCTFAYALSQRGARKVMFDMSLDHLTLAFDNALAEICMRAIAAVGETDPKKGGDYGLNTKCLSVNPPLFFHHKAKGAVNGDSDIENVAGGKIREKGITKNIMWSARNNIRNMLLGQPMESQYEAAP